MKSSLFRPLTLFSAVAVVISLTIAVTLSRVTVSSGGVGKLKCYEVGGTEKCVLKLLGDQWTIECTPYATRLEIGLTKLLLPTICSLSPKCAVRDCSQARGTLQSAFACVGANVSASIFS